MDNVLYKFMINNAKRKIESQNPLYPKESDFDIFQISEILAMLVCKTKDDVLSDILNA